MTTRSNDPEPLELYSTLVDILQVTHRLQRVLTAKSVLLTGLSLEQSLGLCSIDLEGGEATISTIAAALGRTSHTVTAIVTRLERMGMVQRFSRPNQDGRLVWVRLSSLGSESLVKFRAGLPSLLPSLFANANLTQVRNAIDVLSEALQP